MLLVKTPVPEPSIVLLFAVVGFAVVLQQTPLAVTGEAPCKVTFPPPVAVVMLMFEGVVVVTEGGPPLNTETSEINTSGPYPEYPANLILVR